MFAVNSGGQHRVLGLIHAGRRRVTHAAALLQAGFDTAIGGRQVVANSVTEYPAFLAAWAGGAPVGPAIDAANAPPLREPMDRYATEQLHFPGVDSRKQVSGRADLTIHHRPI